MRGHAETKKNEQKTEKNNEMHKNILRNCLCVLAGAAVLTIGIMAPKTIFAMMDKNEIDHIYVQQADTSYLETAAQMTIEENWIYLIGDQKECMCQLLIRWKMETYMMIMICNCR